MTHLVLAVLATALAIGRFAAVAAGLVVEAPPAVGGEVRTVASRLTVADTITWRLGTTRPLDPTAGGALADAGPRVRLGFRTLRLAPRFEPPPLPAPLPAPLPTLLGEDAAAALRLRMGGEVGPEARLRRLLEERVRAVAGGAVVSFLPASPGNANALAEDDADELESLRAFLGPGTELGLRVRGRAELGGDWSRYRPCQDAFQEACTPTLLPQLDPDLLFSVQLGGIINERLRVDVDFDQIDPFQANNTINIVYQGMAGEAVQRMELGDVTFRMPASRFLTEGIPSDNFGFQATGRLGPLDVRAVWAEQKGLPLSRVFGLSGTGVDRGFVQSDTLVLDDADYVRGQFFFLVDPAEIVGYPHVDVLSLDGSEASPLVAPGPEPIQLYRYEAQPMLRQQVQGLIQADAVAEREGERIVEAGWFRYLQPGIDYYVHPSGLWVALRVPLAQGEMLAVTYVTGTGARVGDYNPEQVYNAGLRPELSLLKASAANHQPGRPTWEMEMHQVYRVSAAPDVDARSVSVTLSLGDASAGRTFKRAGTGEELTFLRLFGLDEQAPLDQVDPAFVYQPASDLFRAEPGVTGSFAFDQFPVQGTFLVFPTLRPFLEPPPLRSLGLTEEETRQILGSDANARIYEDTDPFERMNAGRFQLRIPYEVRSQGVISSFSLEALGIREGSERIYVDDRLLTRFVDYEIDYDLGQVTLLDPEALFATDPDAPVRATFEQRQSFRAAPTSLVGFSGFTPLGDDGELNLLALWQNERTLVVRPALGLEPSAVGLGGVSGRYRAGLPWLDGFVQGIPGVRSSAPSSFVLDGEVFGSLPTPNTRGDAFVDDFDAPSDRVLSLLATDWDRGSAPALLDGAETALPGPLDETTYGGVVWQHAWIVEGASGDSLGIREGFLPRAEIDRQIKIAGNEVREQGMRVALGGATGLLPRWASVTTTLSPTGTDLTKSEFLEFYVAGGNALTLVVDLGEVSEDALFLDADGLTSGIKSNGAPWGVGVLDQEADPGRGEIWGDEADLRGVWDESCLAERGRVYRAGDPRAVCTRGNGRQDSEDLNGNGILDLRERHLRWVVRLDGSSRYLVRTRGETGTQFQLYRIPLQGLRDAEVGGTFGESEMRAVRNLRITVAGDRPQALTLARMRIVGSRWIRRGEDGVLRGMVGDTAAFLGRVEAAPVSRVTDGDAYQSPPGVLERLADPTAQFGGQGVEFTEKSLAIRFEDVQPGERAEVYNRFPQTPRAFLQYREARMWVTARGGTWGEDVPHFFFFKVGTDPENFYLYRTPLRPPGDPLAVRPGDWLPEVVVDFERWVTLRWEAELELSRRLTATGDEPIMVWSADSTYAVVVGDRGRAPDLANVREMSFGVFNGGVRPISGELWVDELRLSDGASDPGVAAHVNLSVSAGDLLDARLTMTDRGAHFQQLRDSPSYQSDRLVSFSSTLWLDRVAPESWGVSLPLSLSIDRAAQDPFFLAGSDVRADRLTGLRPTGARRTRVSLGFSKRTRVANPLLDAVLYGLSGNVGWFDASDGSITTRAESQGVDARLEWGRLLAERSFPVVPGFAGAALRALLPAFLERALADARFRWSPERITVGGAYLRHDTDVYRFDRIIVLGSDALVPPTRAPRESLETTAQVLFRPFTPLAADVTVTTVRDLLAPEDASADPRVRELIRRERRELGGVPLGWETQRVVRTGARFAPRLLPWLRHEVDWSTSFAADRHSSYLGRFAEGSDTTLALLRNASGDRTAGALVTLDPLVLAAEHPGGSLAAVLSRIRPVTLTWRDGLASRFNRQAVSPGAPYQLGLGGADGFRFMDADTASILTDRTTTRWSGGAELPLGVVVDLTRSITRATVLDLRSDRAVRDEIWPNVQVRVDSVPVPGPARRLLERVTLAAGYLENLREVDLGGRSAQRRTLDDREVPLDVSLTWLGGSVTSYRGTFLRGQGLDPTGSTERVRETHRFALTSAFVPPFGLAEALDRPVVLGVVLSQVAESECRSTVARLACVPFIDQVNRSVGLTLTALVSGFEVGLEGSATERQSFVGQRPGATQFRLSVFGQFLLDAGVMPAPRLP